MYLPPPGSTQSHPPLLYSWFGEIFTSAQLCECFANSIAVQITFGTVPTVLPFSYCFPVILICGWCVVCFVFLSVFKRLLFVFEAS